MRRIAVLSLIFLSVFGFGSASAAPDVVAAVLRAHRAATGPRAGAATETITYAYSGQGLEGTVVTRLDTNSGAFVTESDLGAIRVANGFDGTMPWMRDISGANTSQAGGDRVRLAINEAYRNANTWWREDRGGAAVSYLGLDTIEGRSVHRLRVTPRGGSGFDAWFDRETGRLVQIAERQMFFDTRTQYRDYERREGVLRATRLIVDGGTGEANYATMRLLSVSRRPARPLSAYSRPTEPPVGVTIDGNESKVVLPFRLLNNHIYVEAKVEGRGPYTFIVDTGGHTILSSRVVAEAGLRPAGAAASAGAGEKTTTSGYAHVREIAIGPIRMREQTAITMDIYDPAVEGIRVDGMIGFELFRRLAVRIDYATKTLTFTPFSAFDASDAGVAIPFVFYDHLPQVEGRLGDIPILFDIDTGSRNEVDVTSPFVRAHNLTAKFPGSITAMTGWGVGGPSMSQVVRSPSLSIGPIVVERPVLGLSRAAAGSFSDANFGGNIGSGLLKRFVTSFDYSRQVMYLKPITPPPADVGTFDRSGLWLNAGPTGFVVAYVAPGGPAQTAGIEPSDIVTAIDGRSAVAEALSDVRAMLRTRPQGDRILLRVMRGGTERSLTLTLQDRL
ncbi:hypothetical protein ACVWZA_000628 [Sphingomonas sp. UYAg733]